MFSKVLVPLDASDHAERILPCVGHLARVLGSLLVLASVVTPRQRSDTDGLTRRGYLEGINARMGGRDNCAISRISFGNKATEISQAAVREGCDLVAMATHGRNALGRVIHGSVADQLIRSSPLPTLTISQRYLNDQNIEGGITPRIIVPLDGTPFAESSLPLAEGLARELSYELFLVRVVDTGEPTTTTLDDARSIKLYPDIQREALAYLLDVHRNCLAKGLNVQSRLLVGSPSQAILDLTYEAPSIVAITCHRRSGLKRLVEGSITDSLVRASGGAVLVIPSNFTN